MFSVQNIGLHFSGDDLFKNISFLINPKDRIGLVGKNGAGKTTLLRIICGEQSGTEGEVVIPTGKKVGYLAQEMILKPEQNVFNETLKAFDELNELERQIANYTAQLSERDDYESDEYNKIITKLHEANEQYEMHGGSSRDADAEKVLLGLGFKREDFERPLLEFSGGWQMRVELAKLLLRRPDLILLDEPTNHLDIESIQWLEDFLINYHGAVVLVSHDRRFLDSVTKRTIEISMGRIYDFKASYSDYVDQREQQLEQQMAAYSNQQQEIKEIERFIERFRYKNTKAKQVQSRVKMLEKMDMIEPDDVDSSALNFRFPPAPRSGRVVFEAKSLTKSYGENLVLKDLDLAILKNDYVAFVGRNGEGKTTLSRIIVNELECEGEVILGHNVQIGYFAQNQAQLLDGSLTVQETLEEVAPDELRPKVRTILGGFLFSGNDVEKKVRVLSGGEKSRLALAKLLMSPVNLLVLDEPTNHLDMRSKDILKNALLHFDGTVIVVSHDRDFLHGLTNKIFEFRNRKIREHLGDVYEFLELRKMENLKELEAKKKSKEKEVQTQSSNKLRYEQKKELDKELRKITNKLKKCEEEISSHEAELERINELLSDPVTNQEVIESQDLYSKVNDINKQLETLMETWEELEIEREEMGEKINQLN